MRAARSQTRRSVIMCEIETQKIPRCSQSRSSRHRGRNALRGVHRNSLISTRNAENAFCSADAEAKRRRFYLQIIFNCARHVNNVLNAASFRSLRRILNRKQPSMHYVRRV